MTSNYLFCVDSDGCAMDTMRFKHELYFGPIAADVFEIEDKEAFLKEWNRINLFSKTRGVNRFVGLIMCLKWSNVNDIDELAFWVDQSTELSNQSLRQAIKINPSSSLQKALDWSEKVNQAIKSHEDSDKPFKQVKEGLIDLNSKGIVMIVSSANKEAVVNEWSRHDLMAVVDQVACQDKGKKEDILHQAIKEGCQKDKILMIGDSPGDLYAAKSNGVSFYPILMGHEESSWRQLREKYVPEFLAGTYAEKEHDCIQIFWENLENN